jgi:glycine oxidase
VDVSRQTDFIIVGQGLAGSVLALQLLQAGKHVTLIADDENYSSRVAAGLFNPVTGKNLSKTWMADAVFAQLFSFYQHAEIVTNSSFFHPQPIYRPFLSIEEQNEWMSKSAQPAWLPFIRKVVTQSMGFAGLNDSLGGLLLKQTGYVDTYSFLVAVKKFFTQRNQFITETFDYSRLHISESAIEYKNIVAEKLIFCEGVNIQSNPLFKWVPVRPLKGETLTVEAALPAHVLVNRGVYAVPVEKNVFKIGATYETQNLSHSITEKAKAELEEKFAALFSASYSILKQEWGLRPTSPDRRPIVGEHPEHKRVLICNGLGTKGVSLAPFTGALLTEFLLSGIKPPVYTSVDVNRYYSLYWKALHNR